MPAASRKIRQLSVSVFQGFGRHTFVTKETFNVFPMKTLVFAASILFTLSASAQQASPPPDRYKVQFFGADLFSAPDPKSKNIGEIPADVVVTPVAKESYWIKVTYKGKTGWISSAGCDRLMASPSADLDIVHQGFKIIGGNYIYYFGLTNRGARPYTGDFSVHLYSGDTEVSLRRVGSMGSITPHTYTPDEVSSHRYPLDLRDTIEHGQGRSYYLVADSLATRYVFETAQGKKEGQIGKQLSDE